MLLSDAESVGLGRALPVEAAPQVELVQVEAGKVALLAPAPFEESEWSERAPFEEPESQEFLDSKGR